MNEHRLDDIDPILFTFLQKEQQRQRDQLQMIPSENYVSKAVMEAVGSVLMNKYSEGQVDKRYYQGNFFIDQIERTVKERALSAFGLDPEKWAVNVQAVTGSVANLAVYSALLEPGDTMMGMFLYDGGHLSHGWQLPNGKKVSFTSKVFNPTYYYVNTDSKLFDYDEVAQAAKVNKPQIIISGGTAYPREIDHKQMRAIADEVGAYYMADIAHEAGLVLAGVNNSPFEHAHVVTMTTRKTLRGPIGAMIFASPELMTKIDSAVFPGLQGGPQNHSIAGIGVALHEAMQPEFKEYAQQVVKNAQYLAEKLVSYDFDVLTQGTDKHLIVVDLRNKNTSGHEVALGLEKANIIVNKNTVPNDTAKPWKPSGIRLGTPALTSRGMKEPEMEKIATYINEAVTNLGNDEELGNIGSKVTELAQQFPVRGLDD